MSKSHTTSSGLSNALIIFYRYSFIKDRKNSFPVKKLDYPHPSSQQPRFMLWCQQKISTSLGTRVEHLPTEEIPVWRSDYQCDQDHLWKTKCHLDKPELMELREEDIDITGNAKLRAWSIKELKMTSLISQLLLI